MTVHTANRQLTTVKSGHSVQWNDFCHGQKQDSGEQMIYQVKVQGRLDESWSDWFCEMTITVEEAGGGAVITTLTGPVADQPALLGILTRIGDLNLTLISVSQIEKQGKEEVK